MKDFIDMLLLAEMGEIDSQDLQKATQATFDDCKTHEIPISVPLPEKDWSRPFQKMANEVGLDFKSLTDAGVALQQFLEPALDATSQLRWKPDSWRWE